MPLAGSGQDPVDPWKRVDPGALQVKEEIEVNLSTSAILIRSPHSFIQELVDRYCVTPVSTRSNLLRLALLEFMSCYVVPAIYPEG